jgi:parvulin-like peptidyl-prolyl isomerase
MAPPKTPEENAELHEAVLGYLIEQRLLLQEARRLEVQVTSEEVAARLQILRDRLGSEEALAGWLREQGLSKEQLKGQLRDQLLVKKLLDGKVRATVLVSPQEVAAELAGHPELARPGERVRALHILLRVTNERSEEQAREQMARIREQVVRGADFADLARRYSEDAHAEEGGRLGWVAQGQLMPPLDTALFQGELGSVSEPIQTRLGFHLLKIEERQEASRLNVLEANNEIFERIYQRKFELALGRWMAELKARAYIDVRLTGAAR